MMANLECRHNVTAEFCGICTPQTGRNTVNHLGLTSTQLDGQRAPQMAKPGPGTDQWSPSIAPRRHDAVDVLADVLRAIEPLPVDERARVLAAAGAWLGR